MNEIIVHIFTDDDYNFLLDILKGKDWVKTSMKVTIV